MPTDWTQLANDAANLTDKQFTNEISNLTRLNSSDIDELITNSKISKEDLVRLLKEIKNSTKSNNSKATAITNINKGVSTLVAIVSKLI